MGKKEERIQVLWFNLTCQDLTNCFFFLDRWFEVQNEGTEGSFRANVGDSLLFPGCMRRGGGVGGGGQDYRDDPAIHPSSKQSPVFPPQTLLIPF